MPPDLPTAPTGSSATLEPALPNTLHIPAPYQDAADHGRLILRDGSTANLRLATAEDQDLLHGFFRELSGESKRLRFFSPVEPDIAFVKQLCDATHPEQIITLLVCRQSEEGEQIIGSGSYIVESPGTAEFAVAILDSFQGKGIGTLLLERLSLLAAQHDIARFTATTHATNAHMLEVFHHSGFALTEKTEHGYVTMEMSLKPSEASVHRSEKLDRLFTAASMEPFFKPGSIAVIGASRDRMSVGARIMDGLITSRFNGPVYPVNLHADVISCIKAYPSVRDIGEPVDLAILVIPAPFVLDAVDDCAAAGVRALVVISSGFAEMHGEGEALQSQLVEKVRGYGMRMMGPNCLGIVNTDDEVRMNASFSPVMPPVGKVAISSQSGALGTAILALARKMDLGLSNFASVGNKADVSGNDLLQYWEGDPTTSIILLYLESFGNPRRFARIARRVSRTKPIIAVKGGRTTAGTRAAGSHTAALASSDVATNALFEQTGVLRVDTLQEMFNLAAAFSAQPLPKGNRVAIITNAGGPGILCTDMCERNGLQVPILPPATRHDIAALLPSTASASNPVDMIASASPDQFRQVVKLALCSDDIDALIVSYTPVGLADTRAIANAIGEGVREARSAGAVDKPVLANLLPEAGSRPTIYAGDEVLPGYEFPEEAATVLSRMHQYAQWRSRPIGNVMTYDNIHTNFVRQVCETAIHERGDGWLSPEETRLALGACGIPLVEGELVHTADEAVAAAKTLGYPVVAKLASHRIVHKTERGGVHIDLESETELRIACAKILAVYDEEGGANQLEGILVQKMVTGATELMIGVSEDPQFGPLIGFGLGGIHVEVLGDVSFRITPLTDTDADEMVHSIRGSKLLEGYRGHDPADVPAIQETLLRLSLMVEDVREICEVDFNPVMALKPGEGVRIVDARIRVAHADANQPARLGLPATHNL